MGRFLSLLLLISSLSLATPCFAQNDMPLQVENGFCGFVTRTYDQNNNNIGFQIAQGELKALIQIELIPSLRLTVRSQLGEFPQASQTGFEDPQRPKFLVVSALTNNWKENGESQLQDTFQIEIMGINFEGQEGFFGILRDWSGAARVAFYGNATVGLICRPALPSEHAPFIYNFTYEPATQLALVRKVDLDALTTLSNRFNQTLGQKNQALEQLNFKTGQNSEQASQIESLQTQVDSLNTSLEANNESFALLEDKQERTQAALERYYNLSQAAERDVDWLKQLLIDTLRGVQKSLKALNKKSPVKAKKSLSATLRKANNEVKNRQ